VKKCFDSGKLPSSPFQGRIFVAYFFALATPR
jgi:hypothetical protein